FFSYTATLASSSTTPAAQMLEVSGSQNVLPGTHTIVIQQLAQAMRIGSGAAIQTAAGAPAATVSDPLGLAGSFQINGATVTVHASDSAADIARKINDLGVGVQASAIQVATGDVRLVIASTQTGAQGFQIGGVDLDAGGALAGLGLGAPASANAYQVLQQGQDAKVVIDGLTLTRASNTITDAIPGLTLDLKQADPATTITMTIGVDREALRASVQTFVDAYNEVADFLNAQFAFDEAKGTSGPLAGEAALHAIQSELADSLLRELPGLAPDRNSLVKIGIEPDEKGHLRINDSLFAKFLNDAPEAIREVFVASGSTSAAGLTFLTPAFQPASGSYTVQITQPALRADIVGTADLSAGVSASSTVTITETATGRVAQVDLTAGMTLQQVLDALNAEFARSYTEKHQLSQALTAGGAPATASTTFAALGLGVQPGDTIAIQGTDHYGRAITQTFTIADPNTTTLGDLLAAIESAYAHAITASLDASGHIVITDATSGESQLSLQLVAHNEG
ncbi:MAG: flagellar hook-associated protein, partial [Zetaproteobacteria bacterium]